MAFTIIPPSSVINDNKIGLGIGTTSLYKPNFDTITQSIEDLKFLLLTHIGEIPNLEPDFGTRLLFVLFEPNSNSADLKETIQDLITTAVTRWLPEIDIEKIDIITSEDDPTLAYNVTTAAIVEIAANNSGTVIVSSKLGS